jgi:protein-tyrosine sulfotransferase
MLYRHGLDVANSLAIMYEKQVLGGPAKQYADSLNQPPRLTFARYWAEQCEKMLAFEAAHPSKCHRIYYEQYATDPEKYLPPVFEFLGEPWDPEVLNFSKKPHDFGLQDSKISETKRFAPKIGTYHSWSQEEIASAKEVAANTMRRLGYEI